MNPPCEAPTTLFGWLQLLWQALIFFGVVHNTAALRRLNGLSSSLTPGSGSRRD